MRHSIRTPITPSCLCWTSGRKLRRSTCLRDTSSTTTLWTWTTYPKSTEAIMFTENERKIFKYYNGEKEGYAVPYALKRKLEAALPGGVLNVLDQIDQGKEVHPQQKYDATSKLIEVVRKEFPMAKAFDVETGHGCMDEDCIKAWNDWCEFLVEKKNP